MVKQKSSLIMSGFLEGGGRGKFGLIWMSLDMFCWRFVFDVFSRKKEKKKEMRVFRIILCVHMKTVARSRQLST